MNKRIRSMIDEIFSEMKMTAENLALRDELMANALARYEDALAQGMTEEEAFAEVAASLGDVGELLREMNGEAAAPSAAGQEKEAPTQEKKGEEQVDLGDALNKAFTALGSWGQSIMPQAKKFARQMDDATGGMLSDLGRAVNKGMQDAQKAAGDVLDKYQREQSGAPERDERPPQDLREEAKDLRAQADLKRVTGDAQGAKELFDRADMLDTRADAIEQEEAMRRAQQETQQEAAGEESPFVIYAPPAKDAGDAEENEAQNEAEKPREPLFGADGELNEEAFARSVEDMSREAEAIVREAGEAVDSAVREGGRRIHEAVYGREQEQKNELRFPAAGLRTIDVRLDADDVIVGPAQGSEIIVRWIAQNVEGEPAVSLSGHTLSIRRKNPDVFKTFFSVFSKNGGQMTLLVPQGHAADYILCTTSGDVRFGGVDADSVEVSTTSGGIRVEPDTAVRLTRVKAETISGNVTVSAVAEEIAVKSVSGEMFLSCDARAVKGETVSGRLHIEGASDDWDADTVSGSAELLCTVVPAGRIRVNTLSGNAAVYLPDSVRGFAVEFESMGGSLLNDFGADRYGTGSLPIRMETLSGKMKITRL